jgi:hypothetical protein
MSDRRPRICPHCSKPLLPLRYGVAFGPIAVRIIDAIAHTGPAGISTADLFDAVYGPNSGATIDRLRSYISQINHLLADTGIAIRNDLGMYRVMRCRRLQERA